MRAEPFLSATYLGALVALARSLNTEKHAMSANLSKTAILVAAALIAALSQRTLRAEDAKYILYFGNSFTNATCCGSTRSVPDLVSALAVAGGHPAPVTRNASANGQSLEWHITASGRIITIGVPSGEDWDHVVLQDFSTMPTRLGDLDQHLSSSLTLYEMTAARSPDVQAIMYETWARGPGHDFYTGASPSFPGGPSEMQEEVRSGYQLSTAQIQAVGGLGAAKYAPVGDAWEAAGFPLDFYASDIYHASNLGTLLNSMILYGSMYGDRSLSDMDLAALLTSLSLSQADGARVAALADAALAVPEPAALGLVFIAAGLACGVRRRFV
ncbi:MAG: PEP-CTERM sorting domain-containing protein [Planctomycetales bacterium]|nr:PEP-CTERM sorting domain-containing protein [Planctomycetales bacterium]